MDKSTKIKVGIAAGLFVLSILLYVWTSSGGVDVPDTDDTRTYWYCTEAKKTFSLSGPESATEVRMVRRSLAGDSESPSARRSKAVTVVQAKSPFSGNYTGVPAEKCPKCGEVFEARDESGEPRNCPACGADPMADDAVPSPLPTREPPRQAPSDEDPDSESGEKPDS